MSVINTRVSKPAIGSEQQNSSTCKASHLIAPVLAVMSVTALAMPASAASLSRSVDVEGTPSQVWRMIGPFCAIKDWLPPVGTCTVDGNTPPTRTLVTKDGKATFVETQTARSDAEHFYTYTFRSSPLPVAKYTSTISVVAKSTGISTVTWQSTYVPNPGMEKDASDALTGIYKAGLDSIKANFTK